MKEDSSEYKFVPDFTIEEQKVKNLVKRLEKLGYEVTLTSTGQIFVSTNKKEKYDTNRGSGV